MIPREILRQVKRIQILTSRKVTDLMAGQYSSVFKGRGMEFKEVRHYQPGDEIRLIDWNVTARTGIPHVKEHVEERELTVMLLVDLSQSLDFGSVAKTKMELAAEFAAVIALSAISNNDKVGLIAFTDQVELLVPPKKGKRHALRLIREILAFKPKRAGTDIAQALEYLNKVTTRRSIAFLVSDFFGQGYERAISIANKRHDLVAVSIADPAEKSFHEVPAIVTLVDPETGVYHEVDARSAPILGGYARTTARAAAARKDALRSRGVDMIEIESDPVEPLFRYFRERERRL